MVAGIRVLVVDDDQTAFERLRDAFAADPEDFEIANAISGPRALGLASASHPDAVIVDGDLPGMDGYTFTAEFKGDDALAAIPVIILANEPNEMLALKARQVGASAHIPKDTEPAGLVAKVKALRGVPARAPAVPVAQPVAVGAVPSGAGPAVVPGPPMTPPPVTGMPGPGAAQPAAWARRRRLCPLPLPPLRPPLRPRRWTPRSPGRATRRTWTTCSGS